MSSRAPEMKPRRDLAGLKYIVHTKGGPDKEFRTKILPSSAH